MPRGIIFRTAWSYRLNQTKSAEYEKPRNSSCIACDKTRRMLAGNLVFEDEREPTGLHWSQDWCNTGKL